jgi:hypothetical protein
MKSPAEIEAGLARASAAEALQYALTGFSGAARFAPFVRYQRVSAYVTGPPDAMAQCFELKEVPSGANVTLLTPYDDGVFYGAQQLGSDRVGSCVRYCFFQRASRLRDSWYSRHSAAIDRPPWRWSSTTLRRNPTLNVRGDICGSS